MEAVVEAKAGRQHVWENFEDFLRLFREGRYERTVYDADYALKAEEHARSKASRVEQEWVIDQLSEKHGPHEILDVACNTGVPLAYVTRGMLATFGHGCDINPDAIRRARDTQGKLHRFDLFDGRTLPYPRHKFNHVMLHHAIAHVQDPKTLLSEIWRVLVPGGTLSIITSNSKYKFWQAPVNAWRDRAPDTTVLRHYSQSSLRRLLIDTGFYTTMTEITGPHPTLVPPGFRASRKLRLMVFACKGNHSEWRP